MSLQHYFDIWKNKVEAKIKEHPLEIISWEATRNCNLNCLHCGSPLETWDQKKELTTKEVVGVFYQIAEDFNLTNFHHINITGGEPFVRKDLWEILAQINKIPQYRNIDLQTNGLYLAKYPERLSKLREIGVMGIGISIDGLEASHDHFRRQKGAWVKAVQVAKMAVQQGFVVTISMVVHAQNIKDIPRLYEIIKEFHPRYFRIMTIDPLGRARLNKDYLLSPEQIRTMVDFLKTEHEKNFDKYADHKTTMVELGCGGWLSTELEGRIRPFIFHCIAGINNLGILYDGKLASCSNISRDFIEGDLRKERIKDVWEKRYQRFREKDWLRKDDCQKCSQWEYCHGGPMHNRLKDGTMLNCLYQTIFHNKDYREKLSQDTFKIVAGN